MEQKYELAACVIVKNEARFLAEWLEYHLLIGVEHFYIYDNDSADDIGAQLSVYADVVTRLHWPLTSDQQRAAYQHFFRTFRHQARWVAFIDADEFIAFRGADLRAYLRSQSAENGIMAQWVLFGTSGHRARPAGLVIENYTQCHARSPNPNIKTICRPTEVREADIVSPHRFPYRDERPGFAAPLDVIAVYHYITRSLEDLLDKVSRGDAWSAHDTARNLADIPATVRSKLEKYDNTDTTDTYMLQFVPLVRARIKARAALPQC